MIQFWQDMMTGVNPLLFHGVLAGLLTSVCCGLVGPYVVARRVVFLSGAIAHIALAGVGISIYLDQHGPEWMQWFTPQWGALIVSIISAFALAWVSRYARERLDTLIGAMWASGMALGLLMVKLAGSYNADFMGYLFGNISSVSRTDLWWLAAVTALVVLIVGVFHKQLFAICLDEEQAMLQGISPFLMLTLLLSLIALTVIALMQVVGLILVIALLCLPPATVGHLVQRMLPIMGLTILLCMVLTIIPRMAVYGVTLNERQISPESAIVLAAGAVYLMVLVGRKIWRGVKAKRQSVNLSGSA